MSWYRLEVDTLEVYDRAGIDPAEPQGSIALARGVLGRENVRRTYMSLGSGASLRPLSDRHPDGRRRYEILYSGGASLVKRTWDVSHETFEWANIEFIHYEGEDTERFAEAGTGMLVIPRPALRRELRPNKIDIQELAKKFHCSQAWVVRRWAQVTLCPAALLSPTSIELLGEDFCWPKEEELRRLAMSPEPLPFSIKKVVLSDTRRGMALLVA